MKKIILGLALLLSGFTSATADDIISGETYRICTTDGTRALSTCGSNKNDAVPRMVLLDTTDDNQTWTITKSGNYYTVKTTQGNFCLDNPSESHSKWGNQVLIWQTSGGDNQKWTFEATNDGDYYLIPFESSDKSKCYAYDETSDKFVFQTKTETTRVKLTKANMSKTPLNVNGYYALQVVSALPSYYTAADGKFFAFTKTGVPSLTGDYTYEKCRLQITTDENGIATIVIPSTGKYVYAVGTTLRASDPDADTHKEQAKFVIYSNNDELNLDTRVAIHAGSTTDASNSTSLKMFSLSGSVFAISSKTLKSSYNFRLVALPAEKDIERLQEAINAAKEEAKTLTGDAAIEAKAAIAKAQSELDYPYITKYEVRADIYELNQKIKDLKNVPSSIGQNFTPTTGINEAQNQEAVKVYTHEGYIVVENAQSYKIFNAAGQQVTGDQQLPSGAYIVVANGQSFKVIL